MSLQTKNNYTIGNNSYTKQIALNKRCSVLKKIIIIKRYFFLNSYASIIAQFAISVAQNKLIRMS